jgi:serine/alanine adding enzyme
MWYRVVSGKSMRYLLMVDMDGTLVSLPYFSWALLTEQKPEIVAGDISFVLEDGKLVCSDQNRKWQVRMLRPLTGNVESHKVVSWLHLKKDVESQMEALPSNVRRKIRKAGKNGIGIISGGAELVDKFYNIYAQNVHRLGAPAMPPGFYKSVAEAFGSNGRFLIATYQNKEIGAALWLRNGNNAEACWFATLEEYNSLYTSYLLWWECIKLSCISGCRIFSFGRSTKGSGTFQYKSQWGTHNSNIYWNYSHPFGNERIKIGPFRINMPKRELLAKIWKKMPGFIVRWLGPMVAGKFY